MNSAGRGTVQRVVSLLAALVAAMTLVSCRVVPPVSAGQQLSASGIDWRTPPGTGWHVYQDDAAGVYLMKLGPGAHETRSAGVHFGSLPGLPSPDAFLEYSREEVIKAPILDRFQPRRLELQLVTERGYPCVLLHVSGAIVRHDSFLGAPAQRYGQVVSLLCQHPAMPGKSFAAVYEYYNDGAGGDIDEEAKAFIDSVRPTGVDATATPRP